MPTTMFQIVKIYGISPQQLVQLHEVLSSNKVRGSITAAGEHKAPVSNPRHAELLTSTFDAKHQTYTVEIRVNIRPPIALLPGIPYSMECIEVGLDVLKAIFQDGLGVYPDQEGMI
ncbi:MAG: hypothetical protein V1846_00895 [Candidatus Komeilibacteria bacterium]